MWHAACNRDKKDAYRIFVGKVKVKKLLEDLKYRVHYGDRILRVLDCNVTISFGVCLVCCGCFNLFCNV